MSVRSIAAAMVRRRGSPTADFLPKAVGALARPGVLGALLNPTVAALTPFVLYTIWTNGPHSSFMQGAYEPILLLYGQLFPPLLIAALGTIATVFVEWVNYHVYRRARDVRAVQNLTGRRWVQRVIRTFDRYPFVVIVCCALGFPRSPCAIAAWRVSTGRASDAEQAIARLRNTRADVVIHDSHARLLQ